jgi:hypothetical protein
MTPARFDYLLEHFRKRCKPTLSKSEHREAVARFLGVDARTLQRYRRGPGPVPRTVAIIATIMHRNPKITIAVIEVWLRDTLFDFPLYDQTFCPIFQFALQI